MVTIYSNRLIIHEPFSAIFLDFMNYENTKNRAIFKCRAKHDMLKFGIFKNDIFKLSMPKTRTRPAWVRFVRTWNTSQPNPIEWDDQYVYDVDITIVRTSVSRYMFTSFNVNRYKKI